VAAELIIPELFPRADIRSEVTLGSHRFDHLIEQPGHPPWYIEVKSCSLVESSLALFPDAPSSRALSHLNALGDLAENGAARAMVLFVVNHSSPEYFAPNYHNDPDFALALLQARQRGVGVEICNVVSDRQGRTRRVEGAAPQLPDRHLEAIARTDSGWLLEFGGGDPSSWIFSMEFHKEQFNAALRAAQRRTGSVKQVIPIRSPAPSKLERDFARGIEGIADKQSGISGDIRRQPSTHPNRASWEFPQHPLENRDFNELLFSLRHRHSLRDLLPG
jgi:sugar fermentation stimulation protein A